jgi:hypothetical protein
MNVCKISSFIIIAFCVLKREVFRLLLNCATSKDMSTKTFFEAMCHVTVIFSFAFSFHLRVLFFFSFLVGVQVTGELYRERNVLHVRLGNFVGVTAATNKANFSDESWGASPLASHSQHPGAPMIN